MALGDGAGYGNTDNNKKMYNPESYSHYNTSNDTGVDPSALSYTFWNGSLKISIAPMLPNPSVSKKWDYKNAGVAWLNHTAARILYSQMEKVLNGELENGGARIIGKGDNTTLITFSNGKEIGSAFYCLIIRTIDSQGVIQQTFAYEFKQSYFGISNFDASNSKFDKTNYENTEIDQLKDLLKEYYLAMTNATAYSVRAEMRFDHAKINTKLGLIAEAMGVEFKGGGTTGRSSSYFDQQGNDSSSNDDNGMSRGDGGSRNMSMEELENSMNPPE